MAQSPRQFCNTTLPYWTDPIKKGETTLKVSAVLSTLSHVIVLLGTLLVPTRVDAQIPPPPVGSAGGAWIWIPTSDLVGAQGFEGAASTDASVGVHFVLRSGLISYVWLTSVNSASIARRPSAMRRWTSYPRGGTLGGRVNFREAGMVPWVSLGGLFALAPGVRYGRSDTDFATRGTMRTRYIIADVGLVLTS